MKRFCLLLLGAMVLLSARAASAGDPLNIVVSNLRDSSFTVSWTTAAPEIGQVVVVGGATYSDDRGEKFSGVTHYVTLTKLQAGKTYQFDIVSGGVKSDNAGAHWSVTTGATLVPPTPDLIVGQVKNPDGSAPADTIVLFTVMHGAALSAPLSQLLAPRDNGFFHVSLSDARGQTDLTNYFTYAKTDRVIIQALGPKGIGVINLEIGDPALHAADPQQAAALELRALPTTPTLPAPLPTPTPAPEPASVGGDSGALIIGLTIAGLVVVGLVVVAIVFVWKR